MIDDDDFFTQLPSAALMAASKQASKQAAIYLKADSRDTTLQQKQQ
jgi:hypothetical protein